MHLKVNVISPTIQEFEGRRFYLCGHYFQRDGLRLHRHVWSTVNNQPVPDGFDVHHKDENKSNNQPENLELRDEHEHASWHQARREHETPWAAIAKAPEWHASEAGAEWHRQHYEEFKHLLHQTEECACQQCGKRFTSLKRNTNHFCSNNCKSGIPKGVRGG